MSSATEIGSALDVALRVAEALDSVGCEYFVGGSVASSLHGEPRATNDIDIVVAMAPYRVKAFAERLGSDFEVDQDMLRDALIHGSCANIFYLPMVTKVDLFAVGSTPYDEVEFNRRQRVRVRQSGEDLSGPVRSRRPRAGARSPSWPSCRCWPTRRTGASPRWQSRRWSP